MVLLLWIIYVISVLFCYASMHVCLLMPCSHLLGKGWPLGSRLLGLIVTLSLSHWYPGSGVLLDCIYSWSLPSFLLWCFLKYTRHIKKHIKTYFLENPERYMYRKIFRLLQLGSPLKGFKFRDINSETTYVCHRIFCPTWSTMRPFSLRVLLKKKVFV